MWFLYTILYYTSKTHQAPGVKSVLNDNLHTSHPTTLNTRKFSIMCSPYNT